MPLSPQQIEKLADRLWAEPGLSVWSILDGAGIPSLLDHLYESSGLPFECLFPGELAPDMATVAPYLVRLEPDSAFTQWVLSGWGEHLGILLLAPVAVDLPALRRHFQALNIVYGPDSQPLRFRYYDPRILGVFLQACHGEQLDEMFGPVSHFVVEGDSATDGRICSLASGALVQEPLSLA